MIRLFLALFTLLLLTTQPVLAATTWTESWSDLARWQPITQDCFHIVSGTADGVCQSAALLSLQRWRPGSAIAVSANVLGEPAVGSSTTDYWAGLTLYQDESHYAEIATERHVPPFQRYPSPQIVRIDPNGAVLAAASPGVWEAFKVTYNPLTQRACYFRNGVQLQCHVRGFSAPLAIELLCVSVGEQVSDNGSSAHCRFGPVTVTGNQV